MLRGSGLTDMTECALRTRIYRRQVPFHRNGRRMVLTDADLREIAEGQPRQPARRLIGAATQADAAAVQPAIVLAWRMAGETASGKVSVYRARVSAVMS
jgi:hypothetical protein